MISKISVIILFSLSCSIAYSADELTCETIDFDTTTVQSKVVNNHLYVIATNSSLQTNRIRDDDALTAKNKLRIGFVGYFKKKEEWNYLDINSKGSVLQTIECYGKINYIMKTPLKNIEVIRLARPKDGVDHSKMIDKIFDTDGSDSSFSEFK